MSEEMRPRLTAEERREQILAAASVVFGERGYAGGTTDAIAKEAGVSQAYVVRMFGGKENLFRAAADRAAARVRFAFRDTIAGFRGDEDLDEKRLALSMAYIGLMADRGLLLTLLHLFSLGHDPVLGPVARDCFLDVFRVVRDEAGFTGPEATEFFSRGMLTTVLLAMRIPDSAGRPEADELMSCAFGERTTDLISLMQGQVPLDDAAR
ncbi:TetR/AcrR family transcriptional regulator [Demequina sp. NBRC 110053]|uniref:TetR/AcrR family transcriptional regulator n=1 Tax=Demequina sp. NBRC 110053 TaxID=1570342 RepID=UPI000A00C7E3|nr:helix-turn-helix domain-containing protein [Demequina sp. NBRC 110053]